MRFEAESSRPSGANSPLRSPKTARLLRAVFGLASKMRIAVDTGAMKMALLEDGSRVKNKL